MLQIRSDFQDIINFYICGTLNLAQIEFVLSFQCECDFDFTSSTSRHLIKIHHKQNGQYAHSKPLLHKTQSKHLENINILLTILNEMYHLKEHIFANNLVDSLIILCKQWLEAWLPCLNHPLCLCLGILPILLDTF